MQIHTTICDRCKVEAEYLPGDLRLLTGGTLSPKIFCDLCADCVNELRHWLATQPNG